MIYFDVGLGYLMTGRTEYWALGGATAIADPGIPSSAAGALFSGVEATAKDLHLSGAFGNRFNLRQKWSAITAAMVDTKRTSLARQPTFATEMPWMIDSFEDAAYDRADLACLAGLVGMEQYANAEDPAASPIFWLSITNAWLMDYYFNVHADSRIPEMVKANLDVLIGQMNDAGDGKRGTSYLWGCPKGTGTGRALLPMFAAQSRGLAKC
jgi:hypothetical protein